MSQTIEFIEDDGTVVQFSVLEQTRIHGRNYLLVMEAGKDEEEAEAYIMRDLADDSSLESVYEIVEGEEELQYIGKIFAELLDGEEEIIV